MRSSLRTPWAPARRLAPALAAAAVLAACGLPPPLAGELDDGLRPHHARLVSAEVPAPTEAQKAQPVVITAHGFNATEFETSLAAARLRERGALVSEVLLGGHGTSLADFSASTWKSWQAPILAEYDALVEKGYRSVGFVTTSTGGTLLLEALGRGALRPAPTRITMVAPLIDVAPGGSRVIGYAGLLRWLGVGGQAVERTGATRGNWYHYRPSAQLMELVDLMEVAKGRLRAGVPLADDASVLVVQSTADPTVDPKGADAVRAGLRGGRVRVEYLTSGLHVPIWPDGVADSFGPEDAANRERVLGWIGDMFTP
jgi:carboxylesterase